MNDTIERAVNEQIRAEFQSAYLYLAMSARFETMNLKGFAHWLRLQWEEETAHAMKFYEFVLQRGGEVTLLALDQPEAAFETPAEAFEQVLAHEQYITGRIHDLYDLATRERDYPLQTLLNWFVEEQVEEEDSVRAIIDDLKLVGSAPSNLFLLDRELGRRTPESETDEG